MNTEERRLILDGGFDRAIDTVSMPFCAKASRSIRSAPAICIGPARTRRPDPPLCDARRRAARVHLPVGATAGCAGAAGVPDLGVELTPSCTLVTIEIRSCGTLTGGARAARRGARRARRSCAHADRRVDRRMTRPRCAMATSSRRSNHQEPAGAREVAQHYMRDLVYGANDGIITTFAVVAGVAGGALERCAPCSWSAPRT